MKPFLALSFVLALSGTAFAQDEIVTLSPPEEAAAIASAERIGESLFRHDRAAAVATDAALRIRGFKRNKTLRGWITTEHADDGIDVVFFGGTDEASPAEFYRVAVDSSGAVRGKPRISTPPLPLQGAELAAARAHLMAESVEFTPCSNQYNSVTLPADEGSERWSIYFLPGTKKGGVVPIGGSQRVSVDLATGETQIRPYTRTCVTLQNDPRAVALMMTHLLDAVPTEVHVFWSLWVGKPIFLSTPDGTLWSVEGSTVRMVKRRGAED
ncbi:MAG TPA: hypothetical protein PKE36_07855 [Chiayiivirga sp.]|nr:hypothetical protein [Chiayiivirga sp.]